MQTTQCPVCFSDVIIEAGSAEKDLISCLNCDAELEIISLQPLQLDQLKEESGEEDDGWQPADQFYRETALSNGANFLPRL